MIFHIPMRINRERASASSIRPVKMIEAFQRLGYEVILIEGNASQRKKRIKEIKHNIRKGVTYDFLYSESSTMPTLLTEKHHCPTHPFLDFSFLATCFFESFFFEADFLETSFLDLESFFNAVTFVLADFFSAVAFLA